MREEAEMEIERAGESVQTVLAEAEESALNAAQLSNQMNNEIKDLRNELVTLCGLPEGCTPEEFSTDEDCRVKTTAGDCGFTIDRTSGAMLPWDPTKIGVSEAGQAVLTFFDAASSVQIANEQFRAFNARMVLELASLLALPSVTLDGAGSATLDVPIPSSRGLAGLGVVVQALHASPAGGLAFGNPVLIVLS